MGNSQQYAYQAEQVVREFFQAVQENDPERCSALIADNGYGRGSQDEVRGPDGARQLVESLHQSFDDLRLEIEETVPGDREVTVRWRLEGTHTGGWRGAQGSQQPVSSRGMSVIEVADGKIQHASWLSNLRYKVS